MLAVVWLSETWLYVREIWPTDRGGSYRLLKLHWNPYIFISISNVINILKPFTEIHSLTYFIPFFVYFLTGSRPITNNILTIFNISTKWECNMFLLHYTSLCHHCAKWSQYNLVNIEISHHLPLAMLHAYAALTSLPEAATLAVGRCVASAKAHSLRRDPPMINPRIITQQTTYTKAICQEGRISCKYLSIHLVSL